MAMQQSSTAGKRNQDTQHLWYIIKPIDGQQDNEIIEVIYISDDT